ncbi:hypothetical protein ANCCAN_07938 [Ancylostoma caninum]|uniref:GDP-fucose protein O-fucosyltransferase 2 n=1 Tax=Ancylostoma caninum TaxID=29170 RepID=A0A368GNY6_ANCCA|nr:hypothetical protein ANCCAN_07938 [Ancylostoma caninum]
MCIVAQHSKREFRSRFHEGRSTLVMSSFNFQLNELCTEAGVSRVFLATDAPATEVKELSSLMRFPVIQYKNDELPDGAVAIVDQWICAHARVFIGSHVSTFSYRIQEDREILGFPPKTTFNRLCPDAEPKCEQPAKWTIVYS